MHLPSTQQVVVVRMDSSTAVIAGSSIDVLKESLVENAEVVVVVVAAAAVVAVVAVFVVVIVAATVSIPVAFQHRTDCSLQSLPSSYL